MIVAMIALTGLVTIGGMAALSIRSGITAVGADRSKSVALYIAESGAAAGADYLRKNVRSSGYYSEPGRAQQRQPAEADRHRRATSARPGQPGNMFSADMNAWYEVEVLNNLDDPGFAAGDDTDQTIIIRATGHGPGGSHAQVELYVRANGVTGLGRPCPSYGQKGMAEDGAGRNDCLTNIDFTDVETYSPGGP
jgi:hypothetical protein